MKIKGNDVLKYIFITLLILFITIYITSKNSYNAYSNHEKMVLTSENIKKFEQDVLDGKQIDINNYLKQEEDYSNKISKTSLNISNKVGHYIKKTLINIFKGVNKLIE